MKDVIRRRYASGRCLITFDPEISEWGNLMRVMLHGDTEHFDRAYSGKWNISVPEGKETKKYSASSGERKQRSPNQCTTLYLIVYVFFRGYHPAVGCKTGNSLIRTAMVANIAGKTSCGSPRVQDLRFSRPEPIRIYFGHSIRLAVIGTILTLPN